MLPSSTAPQKPDLAGSCLDRTRYHNHPEQEKICDALLEAVDTFNKDLVHDMAGMLLEDLVDSSELKTFIEQYGLVLQRAGERIDSPFGKALGMMSRLDKTC